MNKSKAVGMLIELMLEDERLENFVNSLIRADDGINDGEELTILHVG